MKMTMPMLVGFVGLVACGAEPTDASKETDSVGGSVELRRDTSDCDHTALFVTGGLYGELVGAVAPSFVRAGYRVHVPGAVDAFMSYGGDMVYTVVGAGAEAEDAFAASPGAFHGVLTGSSTGSALQKGTFHAAQALFAALTLATETSRTEGTMSIVRRATSTSRVACEKWASTGQPDQYSCTFSGLLRASPSTMTGPGTAAYCPSR